MLLRHDGWLVFVEVPLRNVGINAEIGILLVEEEACSSSLMMIDM